MALLSSFTEGYFDREVYDAHNCCISDYVLSWIELVEILHPPLHLFAPVCYDGAGG